jgi:pimeloyl-ACP methyl ester carboxylesterase
MALVHSRYVMVDGIRTHYLEGGDGPTVVFLHSGEFGGCAELSWEFNIKAFAAHFHVVAPDWLGFGRTDKVFDFEQGRARTFGHMRRFCEIRNIGQADFVGNSMGGSNLARIAAARPVNLPIRSLVLASGGGFAPDSDARKQLLAYDGSEESMRGVLDALFFDKGKWVDNPGYIARRQEFAHMPGAWECTAAARFKAPFVETKGQFGQPDATPYENIEVPVLLIAGGQDPLRMPGYAPEIAARMQDAEVHVYEDSGHCPHIEKSAQFNETGIAFLKKVHARLGIGAEAA